MHLRKLKQKVGACIFLSTIVLGLGGCRHPDKLPLPPEPASAVVSSPTPATAFERDLQFIRQGHFAHVYLFSRKDHRVINKEDGDFLRQNAPKLVDVVLTDEGMRAIGGTNFELEPGNLEALRKRFTIEDYTDR